ncbi:MAG: hypothetical protein AAF790_06475 [Planctomycetota bacterium]
MDPLRAAIACVPLAAYLLLMGVVNLRRRPMLTTGGADLVALGLGLTGFVFIGPIELFHLPPRASGLGGYAWLFWLVLYWTGLALAAMVLRPRLVIYNAGLDQARPAVAQAVSQLDPDARWAGDSVVLPRLGVQMHLEAFGVMRNTSLVASGGEQNLEGWRRLRKAVSRALAPLAVQPNPRSVSFFIMGGFLTGVVLVRLTMLPLEVAKALGEVFAY